MNCPIPMPFKPAERISSSFSPASGTSRDSIPRFVPTKITSLLRSRLSHSRATAIAGITCPPVPPPAINNFKPRFAWLTTQCFTRLLANIQKHAGSQKHDEKTRAAVAHEGQRNPFRGHHSQHDAQIDQRLTRYHHRDSCGEKSAERIAGAETCLQSAPGINRKQRQNDGAADKSKFFT